MNNYLVNVPVRINIWIRPDCQKRQFEIIRKAKPSILFIQSDGGRNEEEWEAILRNRKMIDKGIDWNCTVYRVYENTNLGMYAMAQKTYELIWSKVDKCILLEDDQIPSVSCFKYCEVLFEKYKNDKRIECICGMNHLEISKNVTADYFFSRQGSIWGIATWKRVYEERNIFDYGKEPYIMKLLKQRTHNNSICWKRLNAYKNSEYYEGHTPGSEFWIEFDMYSQNRLQIIPKYNMISNIGCTSKGTHADSLDQLPYGLRKIFNMRTHELKFPLKHPKYVIPDIEYEKKRNRIMGYNSPIISFSRKIELAVIKIKSGKPNDIIKMLKNKKKRISNAKTER